MRSGGPVISTESEVRLAFGYHIKLPGAIRSVLIHDPASSQLFLVSSDLLLAA